MRVLLLDTASNLLDFGIRCQEAGHEVLWYDRNRKDGSRRMAGRGLVPKIVDYDLLRRKYIDWCDILICADNTHYLDILQPYHERGYPIFGPTMAASEWELDRGVGQAIMKKAGIETIPGREFRDYDDAAAFVKKNPTYLVSKPSGDADKALSFVADDAASLMHMLQDRWKKNDKYRSDARKHGFILQEKIRGAEFATGGWFGPGGWSQWWYENLEFKPLMVGDLGPNTGEMGTLSHYTRKSKLADLALKPVTEHLRAINYVGFIDIAGMVKDDGSFAPFEWTMRPGWPTFHNQIATHTGDPVRWMHDLLMGKDTLQVRDEACVSVVMVTGDFPHGHATLKEVSDIPIYGAEDRDHVHLCEVMLGNDVPHQLDDRVVRMPGYVTAGDYVAVITGTGETVTGARRSAYTAVKRFKMPTKPFYRTDIGAGRTARDLELLQKHGFGLEFKI